MLTIHARSDEQHRSCGDSGARREEMSHNIAHRITNLFIAASCTYRIAGIPTTASKVPLSCDHATRLRKPSHAYSEYKSMNAMRTTMMIKNSKKPIPQITLSNSTSRFRHYVVLRSTTSRVRKQDKLSHDLRIRSSKSSSVKIQTHTFFGETKPRTRGFVSPMLVR